MPKKIQKIPAVRTTGRATKAAAKAAATPGSSPESAKRPKEAPTYSQVASSPAPGTRSPNQEDPSPNRETSSPFSGNPTQLRKPPDKPSPVQEEPDLSTIPHSHSQPNDETEMPSTALRKILEEEMEQNSEVEFVEDDDDDEEEEDTKPPPIPPVVNTPPMKKTATNGDPPDDSPSDSSASSKPSKSSRSSISRDSFSRASSGGRSSRMGDPPATGPPSYGGSKASKHTKHSSKSSTKPNRWHEAFDHMLVEVMAQPKDSTLYTMLSDEGYKDAPLAVHKLTDEEIANMSIIVKGVKRPILLANKTHIRVWQAFVYDMSLQGYTLTKPRHIMKLKRKNYRNFQHHVYPDKYGAPPIPHQPRGISSPNPNPTPTRRTTSTSATTSPAELFKKGIKREPTAFPTLLKDGAFDPWSRHMMATAVAQDLGNVLDPKYKPSTPDETGLFDLQKDFMYSVFHNILKTDIGKDLLRKYETTRDAQKVYSKLLEFYKTGNVGADQLSEWMTYLTTTRANDGKWNGTYHGYVLYFLNIVSKYNSYCMDPTDRMTDFLAMTLLQSAVSSVEALHMVRSKAIQDASTHNIKPTLSHYVEALKFAAQDLDKLTKATKQRPRRNVYQSELTHNIDTPVEEFFDASTTLETETSLEYDINAVARVPDDRWNKMTQQQRKEWMGLSPDTRALILGIDSSNSKPTASKPPIRPPRRVNLNELTIQEYLDLQQHFQSPGPTIEELPPDTAPSRVTFQAEQQVTTPNRSQEAIVPAADLRRLLQANTHSVDTSNGGGVKPPSSINQAPRNINYNGVTYTVKNHERPVKDPERPVYRVSNTSRTQETGSLMDRGSNGGVAGEDCRVIEFHPHRKADLIGIDQHMMTGLRIATVGGYVKSTVGPIIIVMHQYAHTGRGISIHSPGHWEYYGANVCDKSSVVGGTQTVTLPGGLKIPMNIVNGLPRIPMRPYTDKEWEEVPHVHVTVDHDWDPRVLDCHITDNEQWYDAQQEPQDWPPIEDFDEKGQSTKIETYTTDVTYFDLQSNFPDHLGDVHQYEPPPELLPAPSTCSESSNPEDIELDEFLDTIVYQTHKTHVYEHDQWLSSTLEPFDLTELDSQIKDMELDRPPPHDNPTKWTWDIWDATVEVHSHSILSFPTTRSQSKRSQEQPTPRPITPIPGENGENGENGEFIPLGDPRVDIDSPDKPLHEDQHSENDDHTTPTAPSARPPGKPTQVKPTPRDYNVLRPLFGWLNENIIKATFQRSTQRARMPNSEILKVHYKSPNPALNVPRRDEDLASDTIFSDTPAVDGGQTCAQIYFGTTSHVGHAYGMTREKEFINTLQDCVNEHGAPNRLLTDLAQVENSERVIQYLRVLQILRWFSEAFKQFQNPAERYIQSLKTRVNFIMDRVGCPEDVWLLCVLYVVYLLNHTYNTTINDIPMNKLKGSTTDISALLRFHFYQEVYYKVADGPTFPSDSREAKGYMVGIAEHVGHQLTYKVLTDDTRKVIYRSELKSASKGRNLRLDLLSGEDFQGGKEFVKSKSPSKRIPFPDETLNADQNKKPVDDLLDLTGRTFLMEQPNGEKRRAKIVEVIQDKINAMQNNNEKTKFRVKIKDTDFEELMSYQEVVDHINKDLTNDVLWKYKRIIGHQGPLRPGHKDYMNSSYNVRVEWEDGSITTIPLNLIAADDPVSCAQYAKENNLLEKPGWKQFRNTARRQKKFIRMMNQAKLRSYRTSPKYMFGYEIPRDYKHAVELDKQNGNTKWQDCTELEMAQLREYNVFADIGNAQTTRIPTGFKKIRVHLVYAAKHDGRHKARLVADGHLTDVPNESVYSGVVSLKGFRLVMFLAELNGLEPWQTDIGNAYLEARTKEKLVIVAGAEFGPLQGHLLRIDKALYGLRTSGLRWHERFSAVLKELGFVPCKTDNDIWLRENNGLYEYIAVYVDDLALVMRNPKGFVELLSKKYRFKFKGTAPISYHLGMDFVREADGTLKYSPAKYIEKMIDNYKRMFGENPSTKYRSPLEPGDHPELDTSDFLDLEGIQRYQSLIGSLQWLISIGRFDVQVAVMTLSSFRAAPRLGHMERARRIVGYVANFKDAAIRIRTHIPVSLNDYPPQKFDWDHTIYEDAQEQIPHDYPTPLGNPVITITYVDANLMHDILTGKSVTGILHFLNQTPIDWFAKKQSTVETATFGSEMVAAKTASEQIMELRTTLRYLGVPIKGSSYMFGDNKSVVDTTTIPTHKLTKRHSFLAFHRVREALAAGYLYFYHLDGKYNPADILSKHWAHHAIWGQLQAVMFFPGDVRTLLTPEYFKQSKDKERS